MSAPGTRKAGRRVVVTGLGVVSPLGNDVEVFWSRLRNGDGGIRQVTKLDRAPFGDRCLAAEVRDFGALPEAHDEGLRQHGQAVGYAVGAARMALEHAGLPVSGRRRMGVLMGTTMGNQDIVERVIDGHGLRADDALPPEAARALSAFRPSHLSTEVARRFQVGGPTMTLPAACAAGNYALGLGYSLVRSGRVDAVLAGGADPFTRTCFTIFYRLGASSPDGCRPFDATRKGMVVGEGAAALVLEEAESARARGAPILAEISGYGLTCDAHDPTGPHPEGRGAIQAMRLALERSSLDASQIDYVSAHGTGTAANDSSEAAALEKAFGARLANLPVSSIKSMLGHCMGAASAFEAVACVLAIRDGVVPPTSTSEASDPRFPAPIDIVPRRARQLAVRHAMSNAFAFGGYVSSVIFSRPDLPGGDDDARGG